MNREIIRMEHMAEHHHFLSYHWARVADAMDSSDPMHRKAVLKSRYHARREKHFYSKVMEARRYA